MKRISLCLIFIFFIQIIIAQTPFTGLMWDDSEYLATERVSTFDGSDFSESSNKKTLKNYVPRANNQGRAGSCVGQAVGYGGVTTMWAIQQNISNKSQITRDAFSALYIYNQINKWGCDGGSTFTDAFTLLQEKGTIRIKDFEVNERDNCDLSPSTKFNLVSQKIESYDRLFNINDSKDDKVNVTRRALLSNKPVLVGIETTVEMKNVHIKNNSFYFKPLESSPKIGGHAMLVVGFDDTTETFELLNSWGESWGNNGFCYMTYQDYSEYCKYGFIMKLKEQSASIESKGKNLKGDFEFVSIEYRQGQMQKIKQPVVFKDRYYELENISWDVGAQFQVIASDISNDDYVYVFSIDSERKEFVHFPKNERLNSRYFGFVESPIVPFKGAEIFIPTKNTALTKDKAGTDYLFVLFSELKLDEQKLKNDISRLSKSKGDLISNFYTIFGDKLIAEDILNYAERNMHVDVSVRGSKFIAPIILVVK